LKCQINKVVKPDKRKGLIGNYCQTIFRICTIPDKVLKGFYYKFNEEEFELRRNLIQALKRATGDYDEIKPRDLADLVHGLSNFYTASDEKTRIYCKKQLKILAKRSALKMPKMG